MQRVWCELVSFGTYFLWWPGVCVPWTWALTYFLFLLPSRPTVLLMCASRVMTRAAVSLPLALNWLIAMGPERLTCSLLLSLSCFLTHTHTYTHGHEPGCAFFSAHTVSRPAHAYWCLSTLAHNARHVKIPRYFSCGSEPKSALIMVARSALLRTVRWQASWQPHMWLCLCLFIRTPPGATCLHPSCPLLSTQEGTGCPHNRPVPFPKINLIHNTLSWPQVVTGRYRQYLCS